MSKNGGQSWENTTPPDAGKWMMWNCVETDPFNKGTAYFAGTKYKLDDYRPYLFKTTDYGKTWTKITNGINNMHFTRAIRADQKVPGILYAGTEFGMYISYDYGVNWVSFQLNLPIVPITDIALKDNDLIVATQGRSFWVLDDLTVVQQKKTNILQKNLHVFPVNNTYRLEGGGSRIPAPKNSGENPHQGIVINYFLKGLTDSALVAITIFDKAGHCIKTYNNSTLSSRNKIEVEEGMNQFVWDMNYPSAITIDGLVLFNGNIGATKAAPGKYMARVKYNNDSADISFLIKSDPAYKTTEAEYDQQVDLLLQIRDKFDEVQKAIINIRSIRMQINEFSKGIDTLTNKTLKLLGDTIIKKITLIEEALYQTNAKSSQDVLNFPIRINDKLASLYGVVSSGQNAPTKQANDFFSLISCQAGQEVLKFKNIIESDLKQFNSLIYAQQIPVIGIK